MPQIPIFIINLKRSEERRTRIQEIMDSLRLTYEFIEAVDGNDFSDSEVAEIQRTCLLSKRGISRGEIGCSYSHLKAYERIVKDNLDYACTMEDDAVIENPEVLRHLLESDTLVALNKKSRFGIINLFVSWPNKRFVANHLNVADLTVFNTAWLYIRVKEGVSLRRPVIAPVWGNVCKIMTKEAANILLREGRRRLVLSDDLTGFGEVHGVRVFVVHPAPIVHDYDQISTIDPQQNIRYNRADQSSSIWRIVLMFGYMILKKSEIIPKKWIGRGYWRNLYGKRIDASP